MTHVKGEDIFDVVEEQEVEGFKYFILKFKSGGREISVSGHIFNTRKFNTKESALWEADRWVRLNPNHKLVQDAFFENEVLASEDVSEIGKTSSTSLEQMTSGTQSLNTTEKS